MKTGHLFEHFSIIKDPRQSWKIEHKLFDILLLTICAVIAGTDCWEGIEEFGNERLDWLKQYGDFENGRFSLYVLVNIFIPPDNHDFASSRRCSFILNQAK